MTKVIVILTVGIIAALAILEFGFSVVEMRRNVVEIRVCQAPDNVSALAMGCE